jgi:hypothetical protein
MNFFFGKNIRQQGDLIWQTAYAMGSGASSIGLNSSTMKVLALFSELSELTEIQFHYSCIVFRAFRVNGDTISLQLERN